MQHGIEMSVLFDEERARARVHRCSTIETKVEGGGSRRRRVYEESRPHEWTFHSCVPLTPSYNPRRTVYGILSATNDTTMRHTHNTHTYKRWDTKIKREKEREGKSAHAHKTKRRDTRDRHCWSQGRTGSANQPRYSWLFCQNQDTDSILVLPSF